MLKLLFINFMEKSSSTSNRFSSCIARLVFMSIGENVFCSQYNVGHALSPLQVKFPKNISSRCFSGDCININIFNMKGLNNLTSCQVCTCINVRWAQTPHQCKMQTGLVILYTSIIHCNLKSKDKKTCSLRIQHYNFIGDRIVRKALIQVTMQICIYIHT